MSDIGKDMIERVKRSSQKYQAEIDREMTLSKIASKFSHMPDEDITILERQVAKILIDAGYLRLEPNCEILEYVLTK